LIEQLPEPTGQMTVLPKRLAGFQGWG